MTYTRLNQKLLTVIGTQSYTIAANTQQNVTVPLDIPSGYTLGAFRRATSGDTSVVVAGFLPATAGATLSLRNMSTSSKDSTATVYALLIPAS